MRFFEFQKKRKILVLLYSGLISLLILGSIWSSSTKNAQKRTHEALTMALTTFTMEHDATLDTWLNAIGVTIGRLLKHARTLTPEEYQKLNELFPVGDILIVRKDGVILNAPEPFLVGLNLKDRPKSYIFLDVLTKNLHFLSQPFRPSSSNPNNICKYGAVPFPDGSGLIEIGCTVRMYNQRLDDYYKDWVETDYFGTSGRFYLIDNALKPLDDSSQSPIVQALRKMPQTQKNEEFFCQLPGKGKCWCLPFNYSVYRLVAVLPYKEYFQQRNILFWRTALYVFLFMIPLTIMILGLMDLQEKNRRIAQREKEEQLKDMERAQTIQTSFLKDAKNFMPEALTFRIHAKMLPAKVVGGDSYAFFHIDKERIGFFIGDVSGKGIPAAIFVMYFRGLLRNNILRQDHDIAAIVNQTNQEMCQNNEAQMFVTSWIGILNTTTGVLEFVNAGHNYPYLRHADGTLEELNKRGGLFLGLFPEAKYKTHDLQLHPGDRLFIYTDGITEAMNLRQQLFGKQALKQVLARTQNVLCDEVIRQVKLFSGDAPQSDDMTILEIAWNGEPEQYTTTMPATEENLAKAIAFLQEHLGQLEKNLRNRLLNAADECLSNIVNYSHAVQFTMTLKLSPDRCCLVLQDDGTPYNPLNHTNPSVHVPVEERVIGGLGILISKKLMDKISYLYQDGKNTLSLLIFLQENSNTRAKLDNSSDLASK